MRFLATTTIGMLALFATGFATTQQAQTPPAPPTGPAEPAVAPGPVTFPRAVQAPAADPFGPGLFYQRGRWAGNSSTESKHNREISKAIAGLKSKDADKRQEAEDQLSAAVGKLFDARTETREKQIKDLEERLAKLRRQLDERKDKKAEICRLHVQTLVNQANGLGF